MKGEGGSKKEVVGLNLQFPPPPLSLSFSTPDASNRQIHEPAKRQRIFRSTRFSDFPIV